MRSHDIKSKLDVFKIRKFRKDWLESLSRACDHVIGDDVLLGVAQTKRMRKKFFAMVKDRADVVHLGWNNTEIDAIRRYLDRLLESEGVRQVILFSKHDTLIGAVRVPAAWVLRNPFGVWKVVGEDLSFALEDLSCGVCLEWNVYDLHGRYVAQGVYELAVWGCFALRL
jgi:hypothetical protein